MVSYVQIFLCKNLDLVYLYLDGIIVYKPHNFNHNITRGDRMIKKLCFLAVIASLFIGQSASFAEGGDLWRLANDKGSIKVFINEPVNESGQGQVIPDNVKKSLESALVNRKSIKFEITKTPEGSDVQISTIIKKFIK